MRRGYPWPTTRCNGASLRGETGLSRPYTHRLVAERHPREVALRRVHGTVALGSATYGYVGSSIYYALGVVAVYALGLTPVTFVIAVFIFAFTAATYTEATVLYP